MNFGEILMYVVSYFGLFTSIYFFLTLYENRDRLDNPKPKKYPSVTIIVPAYNEETTLAPTIDSLLNLDYPKEQLKLIIVDDGSTDNTLAIAKSYENEQVKVLTKPNGGKGSALNLGLEHTTTELVGCLDADSFVDSSALKNMVGYFEDENVMAVTPSLKVYSPKNMLQSIQMIEFLLGIFLRKIFAFLGSIHVTPGPFSIYRKKFFDMYGGYDEHNLTEDIEVALRIQRHNFQIENSIDAFVYTVLPKTWKALYAQRVRWYTGFLSNVLNYRDLFGSKHGNLGLFILPASFISIFLVIISLFYTFFSFISRQIADFKNWYNIDFDISYFFHFDKDYFYYNFHALTLISLISFVTGIIIVLTAKYLAREKMKIKVQYFLYLAFYWAMFGYWWLIAFSNVALKRKVSWQHKSVIGDVGDV